jgi:hypothetical protein
MKSLRIKRVFFIIASSFFVSCAGFMDEATILDAEYVNVDTIKMGGVQFTVPE